MAPLHYSVERLPVPVQPRVQLLQSNDSHGSKVDNQT
jgi:hypothetical protein